MHKVAEQWLIYAGSARRVSTRASVQSHSLSMLRCPTREFSNDKGSNFRDASSKQRGRFEGNIPHGHRPETSQMPADHNRFRKAIDDDILWSEDGLEQLDIHEDGIESDQEPEALMDAESLLEDRNLDEARRQIIGDNEYLRVTREQFEQIKPSVKGTSEMMTTDELETFADALVEEIMKNQQELGLSEQSFVDLLQRLNVGDLFNEKLDPQFSSGLADAMTASEPPKLYHHVRFRESEREEKWIVGSETGRVSGIELKRQIVDALQQELVTAVSAKLDQKLVTLASHVAKLAQEELHISVSSHNIESGPKIRQWEAVQKCIGHLGSSGAQLARTFIAELSHSENAAKPSQTLEIAIYRLIATADIDIAHEVEIKLKSLTDIMFHETKSDDTLVDPDEEHLLLEYEDKNQWKRDRQDVKGLIRDKSHKMLPESLELGMSADMANVARALEENNTLSPESRAEMMKFYASWMSEGMNGGKLDREGQFRPKHWRTGEADADAEEPLPFEVDEHLLKNGKAPWHIQWPVDRAAPDNSVDSTMFEEGVEPQPRGPDAEQQERTMGARKEQNHIPLSFMGVPIADIRHEFGSEEELKEFLNWSRSHQAHTSRGRKRKSRGFRNDWGFQ